MNDQFLHGLRLQGLLSFGPESPEVALSPLNVLIGPNASGKSNFVEALELLHATPADLADPVRIGGGIRDWLWKGVSESVPAVVTARLSIPSHFMSRVPELRYRLAIGMFPNRLCVFDEAVETAQPCQGCDDVFFYYRHQNGRPVANLRSPDANALERQPFTAVARPLEGIDMRQSILSQRRDPDVYPELADLAKRLERIQILREWSFGRSSILRQPQPADLPGDALLPNLANLGLVLNDLEHRDVWPRFIELMQRFLPRFTRLTTRVQAGSVQIYLHEDGLRTPVPGTRVSDGTLRFLALLAVLLNPGTASLVCIEEPELGLHPDALAILAELLVEASQQTQVVVTTHSDALVSALTEHADSVLVTEPGPTGTELRRLESEKLQHWLSKYRLGDIWRMGKLGGNL